MRSRFPSSRAGLRVRLSPADVALAAAAPFAALCLRDVDMVSAGGRIVAGGYVLVSLAASLIAFHLLRISSTIPRYISVGDFLDLAKAVVAGQLMTAIVLFTLTRLDGIPRSVAAIHALILGAGLLISRGLANIADRNGRLAERPRSAAAENVILIGLNDWSVLLVKFLQAQAPEQWRLLRCSTKSRGGVAARLMACRFSGLPHTSTPWSRSFSHMASAQTGWSWAARWASCPARH